MLIFLYYLKFQLPSITLWWIRKDVFSPWSLSGIGWLLITKVVGETDIRCTVSILIPYSGKKPVDITYNPTNQEVSPCENVEYEQK